MDGKAAHNFRRVIPEQCCGNCKFLKHAYDLSYGYKCEQGVEGAYVYTQWNEGATEKDMYIQVCDLWQGKDTL